MEVSDPPRVGAFGLTGGRVNVGLVGRPSYASLGSVRCMQWIVFPACRVKTRGLEGSVAIALQDVLAGLRETCAVERKDRKIPQGSGASVGLGYYENSSLGDESLTCNC